MVQAGSKAAAPPIPVAVAVPPNAQITSSKQASVSLDGGATGKASSPVVLPKNTQFEPPKVLVGQPATGGNTVLATFNTKITGVTDGDGIRATKPSGKSFNCRLDSINAPEVSHDEWTTKGGKKMKASPDQAYGQESKKSLEQMVLDKDVSITITQSKEGREFCQVSFQGKDVSLKQVEEGMAWVYDRYISPELYGSYKSAEAEAKKARKGLWQNLTAENPADFAHRQQR